MARGRRATARVAFAELTFKKGKQPLSFADALEESLEAGTETERYNRLWRMARHVRDGNLLFGRIGFEHGGETETWDAKTMDFVEAMRKDGRSTPFAVDADTHRVAFQLRGGTIKIGTFVGAFKALLNEAAPHYEWSIRGEVLDPWEEWVSRVDRVIALSVKVNRPNPTYRHEQIGDIIEGSKAKAFNIGLTTDVPEGLNMEDDFIVRAIEQAEYSGEFWAKGEITEAGRKKGETWRTAREGAPVQKEIPADPSTGEPTHEALGNELQEGEETE